MKYALIGLSVLFICTTGIAQRRIPRLPSTNPPKRYSPPAIASGLHIAAKRKPAPDTHSINLEDGTDFKLSEYGKGFPLIVAFGANYCKPCETELPRLVEVHNQGKIKVVYFLAGSPIANAFKWIKQKDPKFPILYGTKKIHEEWGVVGYPMSFLVGSDRMVEAYSLGYQPVEFDQMVTLAEMVAPKRVEVKPLLPTDVGPLIPEK